MNDVIKHKIKHNAHRALVSVKWVIFAILVGGIVGLCGTAFYFCLTFVTVLRGQNPWLLYLLPVGGLIIVGAYHLLRDEKDTGTNLVISAIHSDDELPLRMAPLIFISTVILFAETTRHGTPSASTTARMKCFTSCFPTANTGWTNLSSMASVSMVLPP